MEDSVKIVVVGGGAGGLPLVTRLGRKLGRRRKAQITLVDGNGSHIWKPRFHEVATGAIDADLDAVNFLAHARENHYRFARGWLSGLDRENKTVILAPLLDKSGNEILPERRLSYDYLVIALGSVGNDFNTPGVREHCLFLDSRAQAELFHENFLNHCERSNHRETPVSIAIVGGGATGVELAAEIHHAVDMLKLYGHEHLDRSRLQVHLVEAAPRILPALNEKLADSSQRELERIGVTVHTSTFIQQAESGALVTKDGKRIEAELLVWAAGIKAPEFLSGFGLATNRIHQLVVNETLQTEDPAIFAIGDCCACILSGSDRAVPPRAQAAQQMAVHTANNIQRLLRGEPLEAFKYRDHGSLVSLSNYSALGNLMGSLRQGSLFVEGRLARTMYISLYRYHQAALYGWARTLMLLLAGRFNRLLRPRLKLH